MGQSSEEEYGILLNVDYGEELTRYRLREVFLMARRHMVPNLEKVKNYILADSFYIHYRQPILRGGVDNDKYRALWRLIVSNYINSEQYAEVSRLTRLNGRLSRIMAVKLLRIYVNMLNRIERNERLSNALKDVSNGSSQLSKESRNMLDREIKSLISFYMGNMKKINDTINKVRSILGPAIGHEVAELILDTDVDPYRARLVNMLNSLLRLVVESSRMYDEGLLNETLDKGVVTGIKRMSRVNEVKDLTPINRALARFVKPIYAYKLATGSLTVKERRMMRKPKIYLVIDKSGSMFYTVMNNIFEYSNVSKITWAAALAIVMIMKGHEVVARFFDQQIYQLMTNKRDIVKTLLSLVPLGGTNITSAIRAAYEDARRNPALRNYKLVLITDGEDDELDLALIKQGLSGFSDYRIILIGNERSALETLGPKVTKIHNLNARSLINVLRRL
jgi:uncharacterized protein with von Willebrand factor type A (vWA) domain